MSRRYNFPKPSSIEELDTIIRFNEEGIKDWSIEKLFSVIEDCFNFGYSYTLFKNKLTTTQIEDLKEGWSNIFPDRDFYSGTKLSTSISRSFC